jgi:hypothetical protein
VAPDPAHPLFAEGVVVDAELRVSVIDGELSPRSLVDAEQLLRDIAAIEERRGDELESGHALDPAVRRIEAKLDLALQLFAQALPQLGGPPPRPVRIGPAGVQLGVEVAVGDRAILRWQPADALPMCLQLPVRRVARDGGADVWAFEELPPSLEDALSRHLFRLHRRALAAQRRA